MRFLLKAFALILLTSCGKDVVTPAVIDPVVSTTEVTKTYLALGDSYTIGQSVPLAQSFPYQLAAALKTKDIAIKDLKIIAQTGWTTNDLQTAIANEKLTQKYNLVTLLIGVNNQYRHYSTATYRIEFANLLNTAIQFANGDKTKVVVISIPDWSVTPYTNGFDRNAIATEIDQFNAINKDETSKAGVAYVDITPYSRTAATNTSLVAADGLHPSAIMYSNWVQLMLSEVLKALK